MVDVNGGMVPPLLSERQGQRGGPIQGGGPIKVTFTHKSGSVSANINPDKGSLLYDKKADYGKKSKDNEALTVSRDVKGCKATIYLHCWLNAEMATSLHCAPEDIQETIDAIEMALTDVWANTTLPCSDNPKKAACTFDLKIVWHLTPGDGVIKINPRCTPPGSSTPGVSIDLTPPSVGGGPLRPEDAAGYYGHELGHQLFGTGSTAPYRDPKSQKAHKNDPKNQPEPWDIEGHNPKGGFMRDTRGGNGIKKGEKPTPEEVAYLVDHLGLCNKEDCCKEQKNENRMVIQDSGLGFTRPTEYRDDQL